MATTNLKEIYADVEKVYATKGKRSLWPKQPFKHAFDGGVRMLGVMRTGRYRLTKGDLVLKSLSGKQLWKNFEYQNTDPEKPDVKKEPFLENPPNLIVIGANPPRKLRRKRKGAGYARKRRFRVGRAGSRHRPVVYTVDGQWKVSPKAHIAKRGAIVNPLGSTLVTVGGNPMAARYYHYYRRKSNPARLGLRGITEVQKWAPLAVWGALSATATGTIPAMFGLVTPMMKIGGQLVTAFMGGALVRQFWSKEAGNIWMIVGSSLVMYDFLKAWVYPQIQRVFPAIQLSDSPEYHSYHEALRADSQQVGQYPDEMQAYPEEVSAYPEEVSAWPYNGDYPY